MTPLLSPRRKNLLLLAVAMVVAAVGAEVLVRVMLPAPWVRPFSANAPAGMVVPHPTRDFAYRPGYVGQIATDDYQIRVAINSLGFRSGEVVEGEGIDILAVGNSFTVGFGVEAAEAWPAQLETTVNAAEELGRPVRVFNAAVSGYNLAQIRLLIEELLYLEPRVVLVGLYPAAYRRLHNPYVYLGGQAVPSALAPHLRPRDGGFLYSPLANPRLRAIHFWSMRNLHLAGHLMMAASEGPKPVSPKGPLSKRLAPLLEELGRINRQLRERGTPLAVLLVNHQGAGGSFAAGQIRHNALVRSFCAEESIPCLDLIDQFESAASGPVFRIGRDYHWSARAHALAGRQFGAFLLRQARLAAALRERG